MDRECDAAMLMLDDDDDGDDDKNQQSNKACINCLLGCNLLYYDATAVNARYYTGLATNFLWCESLLDSVCVWRV